MAIQSSILAWEIPWTEEPGGLQLWGSQQQIHSKLLSPTIQMNEPYIYTNMDASQKLHTE